MDISSGTPDIPTVADLAELAVGGEGTVYQGYLKATKCRVLVKVFHGKRQSSHADAALAAMSVHVPGIPTVLERGTTSTNNGYIVMELVEGVSLFDVLQHQGPLRVSDALDTIVRLAKTIEHLHEAGVVHNDIKPENIVLSHFGSPVLIDFGISQMVGDHPPRCGSIEYSAPEALLADPESSVSPATDIYSLGAILYALLTGQPPMGSAAGGDSLLVALEKLSGEPDLSMFSDPMRDFLQRTLTFDASARPTAHEFIDACETLLQQPLPPRSPGSATKAVVKFGEQRVHLQEGGTIIIGRHGDLVVGAADKYVSRVVANLSVRDGRLVLENISSHGSVTIIRSDGLSVILAPGELFSGVDSQITLRLQGTVVYDVDVTVMSPLHRLPVMMVNRHPGQTPQLSPFNSLTESQRRLLAAYCAPLLRRESDDPGSHVEAAAILGISPLTARNRIERLAREVNERLGGSLGPRNQKDDLCRLAIRTNTITSIDLGLLPAVTVTHGTRSEE